MKMRKAFFFNMVEIALAFAIVGVGVASIMSLISVGVSCSKDAIGDNNAPMVARNFISYFERYVKSGTNWSTIVNAASLVPALPENVDNAWGDDTTRWIQHTISAGNPVDWAFKPDDGSYDHGELVDVIGGLQYYKKNSGDMTNMYRYNLSSEGGGGFKCDIRVWKAELGTLNIGGTNYPIGYSHAVAIFVEVSWPVEVSYSQRQRRYYRYEIFNPNI